MPATSTASGQDANGRRPGARLITSSTGFRAERPTYRIWFCSVTDTTGWRTKAGGNWPARMTAGCWRSHRSTTTTACARRTPSPSPDRPGLPHNCGMAGEIRIGCSGWSYPHWRERFEAWRQQAPAGFLFAVKGSRYVTHIKRLAVEKKSVDLVVDAALGLGETLGPILFQLQANFHLDLERLERFVGMLPSVRFTIEFRHDSWLVPGFFA